MKSPEFREVTAQSSAGPAAVPEDLLKKIAAEIALAVPGKNEALLPLNCLLAELTEFCKKVEAPLALREATIQAAHWIDVIIDTTAVFDSDTIQKLTEWIAWMPTAFARHRAGESLDSLVTPWNKPGKSLPTSGQDSPEPSLPGAEPSITLNLAADGELLREFINEAQEHLQNVEQGTLVLEENPTDSATLNSVFRAFHTFKGGAGFMNLTAIKNLAHELESLLDAARQHKLVINSAVINLILEGGDTLRQFVAKINAQLAGQQTGQPIIVPTTALIAKVKAALEGKALTETPANAVAAPKPTAVEPAPTPAPEVMAVTPTSPAAEPPKSPQPPEQKPATPAKATPSAAATAADNAAGANGGGFVRVDTSKLDSLIDLVGELAIAKSMVVQDPALRGISDQQLSASLTQLARITGELQRTATSLRMVPIRATFQKMSRVVRDVAARQRKQVQLITSGEETELDRNIVEELNDPLIHMIRNALDHGIETPEIRKSRGKPETGTILLKAMHRGGNIVISIQDDGNGLNKERILAKAREQGILQENETPSEKEIFDLIFAPGFSTAEIVSDISGRGVGMDVVRNNIEKLRGSVDIDSVSGSGTTFTIYLPLTLAIIDGMIVSVGGERYIIPTFSVRESFRPAPGMISTLHERGEMVTVRGELNPLLRLYEHFNLPPRERDPAQSIIIVVESGQQTRCLLVDELLGKQEVVTKSLGEVLKKNRSIAGTAVLGDGRVGLILDVDSLVRLKSGSSRANVSASGSAAAEPRNAPTFN